MRYKEMIFTSHSGKLSLLIFTCAIVFSCKKGDTSSTTSAIKQPDCVDQHDLKATGVIEGQYIIAYKPSSDLQAATFERLSDFSKTVLQRNKISSLVIETPFAGQPGGFIAHLSRDEMARLKNDADIEAIEPDRVISLSTCFTVAEPRLVTWNIERVGFGDGTGKTAWVIDTGIDFTHPDLIVDQTRSKSFVRGITSANDDNGHGTHVAGVIGARNNNFGVMGVAAGATLVSLKVLDKTGSGNLSSIIEALAYVNTNGHAGDAINLSLGEDSISTILDQQVENTAARGIYIAIAAGNDKEPAKNFSPARANGANVYTVSAIDSLDNFASFSNYGNDVVDYAVPGVRILSTYKGGKYAYMSGTSMATPHMTGLLLLKGNNIVTSGHAKNDPDGTPDPIAHY